MLTRSTNTIIFLIVLMASDALYAKTLGYWQTTYLGEVLLGSSPNDVGEKLEPILNASLPAGNFWQYRNCHGNEETFSSPNQAGLHCDKIVVTAGSGLPVGFNLTESTGNGTNATYVFGTNRSECPDNPSFEDPAICQFQCDCDQDLQDGACVVREVEWLPLETQLNASIVTQFSTPNNLGIACGREQELDSCPVEAPIQNVGLRGNPIHCATGQKIQSEVDYQSSVGDLRFSRVYLSKPEREISDSAIYKVIEQE